MRTSTNLAAFLISLLLLTITQQQTCPLSNADYLQSGMASVVKSQNSLQEQFYDFTPSFVPLNNAPIQAVASSTNLPITWNNGMDFFITAQYNPLSNRVTIIVIVGAGNSWNSILISYFISGRPQFYLGSYMTNVYLKSYHANGQPFLENIQIPGWTSSNSIFKGIVQYSGIRCYVNAITVRTQSLNINSGSGILTLSIRVSSPSAPRVHLLQFSFIVFRQNPITHSSFVYQGTIPPSKYVFIGIQQITTSLSTYEGHSFFSQNNVGGITCIGGLCTAQCLTVQQCSAVGGVVNGNSCFRCRQGQVISGNQCVFQNQICGQNEFFDQNIRQCVCNTNSVRVNNVCYIICGVNGYILNGNCVCRDYFIWENNQCVRPICAPNSNPNPQGICICDPGFTPYNNQCYRTCPVNQGLNTITNVCIQCNGAGHYIQNFLCKCINPYFLTNFGCQSCPANSQYDSVTRTCKCNIGFQPLDNQCVRSCTPPQVLVAGACLCPPNQGINPVLNTCVLCTSSGSYIENNICKCLSTHFPSPNGCLPCPTNSAYNAVSNSCRCYNGYEQNGNQCVRSCTPPQVLVSGVCLCPPNQAINQISNICAPCISAGSYIQSNICKCRPTHFPTASGCFQCPANSAFDPNTQTCKCNLGFYQSGNSCLNCHSTCATCTGPSDNQCTSCHIVIPPITPNNGYCVSRTVCPSGQYTNANNGCSNCLTNCISCTDGVSCTTCRDGYSKVITGSTISCVLNPSPDRLQLTLKGTVVGNSKVYQGVTMNLMPTAILSGGCSICNNLLRVTLVGGSVIITPTVQYVTDSQYRFLITYSFNAPFIPTFQYKITINPIHAQYFKPEDMVLRLDGTISDENVYSTNSNNPQPIAAPEDIMSTSTNPTLPNPLPFRSGSSGTAASGAGASTQKSKEDILRQIFG